MTKETFLQLDPNSVRIIDIREDSEIANLASPEGSIHIPMQILASQIQSGKLPKDKPVITVCYSGGRCHTINQFLQQNGYTADYLEGGVAGL